MMPVLVLMHVIALMPARAMMSGIGLMVCSCSDACSRYD